MGYNWSIGYYMFAYMNTENKGHANRSMQYPANWQDINLQSSMSHSTVRTWNFFGFQVQQIFSVHLEKNSAFMHWMIDFSSSHPKCILIRIWQFMSVPGCKKITTGGSSEATPSTVTWLFFYLEPFFQDPIRRISQVIYFLQTKHSLLLVFPS